MKSGWKIFMVLGWVSLLIQIRGYLRALPNPGFLGESVIEKETPFIIANRIPFVLAIVFFILAFILKRKSKQKKQKQKINSFLVDN